MESWNLPRGPVCPPTTYHINYLATVAFLSSVAAVTICTLRPSQLDPAVAGSRTYHIYGMI